MLASAWLRPDTLRGGVWDDVSDPSRPCSSSNRCKYSTCKPHAGSSSNELPSTPAAAAAAYSTTCRGVGESTSAGLWMPSQYGINLTVSCTAASHGTTSSSATRYDNQYCCTGAHFHSSAPMATIWCRARGLSHHYYHFDNGMLQYLFLLTRCRASRKSSSRKYSVSRSGLPQLLIAKLALDELYDLDDLEYEEVFFIIRPVIVIRGSGGCSCIEQSQLHGRRDVLLHL